SQCRPAAELFERALRLFEEAGRSDEVGRTLSTSIQPLILLGEYEQALRNADRAREIFTCQKDQLRLARLEINTANIHHRQERFAAALASYERAYQQLLPYGDTEAIGVALHNMAVCLISLNDFDHALDVYEQARKFFQQHEMPRLESQADYNIGYLYYLRGDYERAIEILRTAREASCTNGDVYHAALCDLDQSEIYLELNLTDEAAQRAQLAADQFEQLGMGYEAARSVTNLAIALSQKRETNRALELFARSKALFSKEGHPAGESLVHLYQAVLLFELGNLVAAQRLCSSASQFFRSSGLSRKAVICDLLKSRLALAAGDFAAAHSACHAALADLESLEAPVLSYQAHMMMGQLHEASGEFQKSYAVHQAARREIENLRSSLQGEELRISFMTNKLDVYDRLIQLCLRRGLSGSPAEEAFSYMEQAKGRSLLDAIFGRAKPLPTRVAADRRSEAAVRGLRGDLNWYYHRIELEQFRREGVCSERIRELWAQARGCEDALLRAVREMPDPHSEKQVFGIRMAATLSAVQASLDPGSTLLEYYQTGEQILAVVLSAATMDIVPLTTGARVKDRLRMLQFQLSKFRLGSRYTDKLEKTLKQSAEKHLRELYDDLMGPVRPLLKGRHLILVPHGLIHYLPLHALHDGDDYLIDRFTVSYAPSASIYTLCRRRATTSCGRSLILGIHDSKAPWIHQEVQEVAAVVPEACLFLGSEASQQVLRELGPQSRLIHVATHGIFRGDNPMFSAVRLGDSYLSLYDLYNLRLPVELFTLSGCATGLNVVAAGDELIGLARGLLYAGAQTLLLTLWDVHDRSTADFMRSFYLHLERGSKNKAQALQAAMLELRHRYPHPYHWAPFILFGKAP
ncbi:MAG: CHAT domain-containing protein, partial [Bryobacteraceae bacterium]